METRTITAALIVASLSVGLIGPTAGSQGLDLIQPGDDLDGICTLNFVFDAPVDRVLIGTAAHCVEVGAAVNTANHPGFGEVVWADAGVDFALIEVRTASIPYVSAEVLGHPGMPTGTTTAGETGVGDLLHFSGHGIVVSLTRPTRESRFGLLMSDTAERYTSNGPVVNGDSGGPILHAGTGKALGIVSEFNLFSIPPTTDVGPTMEGILQALHGDGYLVTLRTA